MPRLLPFSACMALVVLLGAGCDDRLRLAHRIHMTVAIPGVRAVSEIEDKLDPDTLELLGGNLPEIWPEELPPVSFEVPIEVLVLVERPELDEIGRDLAGVSEEDFELRLRGVDWSLEQGDLTHPLVDVELWVGPEGAARPGQEGTKRVGHFADLDAGAGPLLFAPGGRRALSDHLVDDSFVVLFRAMLSFDTSVEPRRPRDSARLSLTFNLDVLK